MNNFKRVLLYFICVLVVVVFNCQCSVSLPCCAVDWSVNNVPDIQKHIYQMHLKYFIFYIITFLCNKKNKS